MGRYANTLARAGYAARMPAADTPELLLRSRVEDALLRDDPLELEPLVLELALHSTQREWAEACCAQLSRHRNARVRGNALAGFAHLARRFGQLDLHRVKRRVELALFDRHEYVRAQAESAATDLETYLCWQLERPETGAR